MRQQTTPTDGTQMLARINNLHAGQPIAYASILAGGVCNADCYFCIGRDVRGIEAAHTGPNWRAFIVACAAAGVRPYMSLSGVNSDPTLLPDITEIIITSHGYRFPVALHTNGYLQHATFYELSDKITLSHQSWDADTFSKIMRKPARVHALPTATIQRWAPTGKMKLSVTYVPENAAEITGGRYFAEALAAGIRRVVVRKWTESADMPTLPATAVQTGEYHGQPIYDVGGVEVTVWDYAVSNESLPAVYYWPNGRVEKSAAWEDLAQHREGRVNDGD